MARLAIWLIAPFLFTGVGWWLDSLLLTGFKAAVLIAVAVAWFVDFEFGRFRQREYVANLGFGRLATFVVALGMAFLAEIGFFLVVTAL